MSNPVLADLVAPLLVRSAPIADPGALLSLLPEDEALAWVHGGDGLVGWGRTTTFSTSGSGRFTEAADWWRGCAVMRSCATRSRFPDQGSWRSARSRSPTTQRAAC
ncbi:hypothetical protein [Aeromicrobium sp. UC242_57]|uniref:hypothetical protein n=1 Tax=Aeromicrobium sp. UC242_57 TaxID=3374624 RepID=UPI0037B30E82